MARKWFVMITLLALIGLLTSTVIGLVLYRDGWSHGYRTGRIEADGELDGSRYPIWHPRAFLCGLGLFFKLGLLFMLFLALGGLFRRRCWAMGKMGRPGYGPWHRPPWHADWSGPPEEPAQGEEKKR